MAKICLIVSSVFTIGGEQRVTTVIANELAKKNELIIYTTEEMDTKEAREQNPYHLNDKIPIRYTKQPKYPIGSRILRRILRDRNEKSEKYYENEKYYKQLEYAYFRKDWQEQMLAELTKETYDIIIAVSGGNTMQLGLIADRLDCMTVGWMHNSYEAYFETPNLYFYHQQQLFRQAIQNLDHCVVLNHYIKSRYLKTFGKECDVIYNPRSFVSEEKSDLTNKTFVGCGRFITQKGFDLLIESFHEFAKKDSEWKLVLVGDGEMRPELEKKISEYGLEARVVLTGYTREVKKYLQEASVYVLSSRWEGFPMVLTEAFEMGLPAVAFDITAVEPLIDDEEEGLLAESFDTKDFAEKMFAITQLSSEELKNMADKAKKKAESLAIENIMKQWETLLERKK